MFDFIAIRGLKYRIEVVFGEDISLTFNNDDDEIILDNVPWGDFVHKKREIAQWPIWKESWYPYERLVEVVELYDTTCCSYVLPTQEMMVSQ